VRRPRRAGPAPRLRGAAAASSWTQKLEPAGGSRAWTPSRPSPACAPAASGARGLGGGAFAGRVRYEASEHRGSVAAEDLLARILADLGFNERLPGPVAAEFGAVGTAHDAIGAVQPHGRFDRARAERVAVHVDPCLLEARRRQLLVGRVEQRAMVHALDLVRNVAAQIVD